MMQRCESSAFKLISVFFVAKIYAFSFLFSAQNLLFFYFEFALFFSVFSNFQSFLSVASHIPDGGTNKTHMKFAN